MSIYHKDGFRYTLRTDGFISVRAGATRGELTTKPIRFSGSKLEINYGCSAAGGLRVEIQDAKGKPMAGFNLSDAEELIGDRISQRVEWKNNPDLSKLAGKTVRIRFSMLEADLFSFRFHD